MTLFLRATIPLVSAFAIVAHGHYQDENGQSRAQLAGWLIPVLLSIIGTLSLGAFLDQRNHQAATDAKLFELEQRIGNLEGTDRLSITDRAALREELKRVEDRQFKVISVLGTLKPEAMRGMLESK